MRGSRRALHRSRSRYPTISAALATIGAIMLFVAAKAEARITIRPHAPQDTLFFHAHFSEQPFDPSNDFTLEIWNCTSGVTPSVIVGQTVAVVCPDGASGDAPPATLAYSVQVPGGSCVDRGRSCYYRNREFDLHTGGTRYFRVRYSTRSRGNRVWLESFGDLSAADQARMLFFIRIDGHPRAVLEDTFVPLPGGGWFSPF